jgi:hypothetical protein
MPVQKLTGNSRIFTPGEDGGLFASLSRLFDNICDSSRLPSTLPPIKTRRRGGKRTNSTGSHYSSGHSNSQASSSSQANPVVAAQPLSGGQPPESPFDSMGFAAKSAVGLGGLAALGLFAGFFYIRREDARLEKKLALMRAAHRLKD